MAKPRREKRKKIVFVDFGMDDFESMDEYFE